MFRQDKKRDERKTRGGGCNEYSSANLDSFLYNLDFKGMHEHNKTDIKKGGKQSKLLKRGGQCDIYGEVNGKTMLLNNAITQYNTRNGFNPHDSKDTGVMYGFAKTGETSTKGGADKRRVMRKGGTGLDGILSNPLLNSLAQGAGVPENLMPSSQSSTGGNGRDCRQTIKKDLRGGTAIVELAPFISSLVLLGLRVANDPVAQRDLTNQLTRMVSLSSRRSAKN